MTTAPTLASAESTRSDDIGVMIVDDSAVVRGLVTRMITAEPGLSVVASVGDGSRAIAELKRRPEVDIIVLDIEMPVMDGLTALPQLLAIRPGLPILMASTLTQRNAEISLQAIRAGAVDYVPKPSTRALVGADEFQRELIGKLKALGGRNRRRSAAAASRSSATPAGAVHRSPGPAARNQVDAARAPAAIALRPVPQTRAEILCIGSSTGGPQALSTLFKTLKPASVPYPVLITQHMPPTFTTIFAEHLSRSSQWPCAEAKNGERLEAGHIYVAPGDFHMEVERTGDHPVLRLSRTPPENFCRPSVDPMLRSVVKVFGGRVLVAILTGMGSDGCRGADVVVKAGGTVVAQDEDSSVVWGMPGAVATAGLCSAVVPLDEMAKTLANLLGRKR